MGIKKIILLLSLILLCGCGKESITDKMISYMNNKYSEDTFEFSAPTGGGTGSTYKTIMVSSREFPNSEVYVRYNSDFGYSDNYLGVKYDYQTREVLNSILSSVTNESYVFLDYEVSRYACPNKDGNMTFEDYIVSSDNGVGFIAVVNYIVENRGEFVERLEDAFKTSGIYCLGTVYFEEDLDKIMKLKSETVSGYIYDKSYSDSLSFVMGDGISFSKVEWGE